MSDKFVQVRNHAFRKDNIHHVVLLESWNQLKVYVYEGGETLVLFDKDGAAKAAFVDILEDLER